MVGPIFHGSSFQRGATLRRDLAAEEEQAVLEAAGYTGESTREVGERLNPDPPPSEPDMRRGLGLSP